MAGILLASGQSYVISSMKYYIDNVSSGLYIGLMTNTTTPSEGSQIGTGITEISPTSGYSRQLISSWTATAGTDPTLSGSTATFNVSGTWSNVEGYFVAVTSSGINALWAEVFPAGNGGTKYNGEKILVTPIYEQQYKGEV